jgi:MFS superfamily sulfate permease-like transporter
MYILHKHTRTCTHTHTRTHTHARTHTHTHTHTHAHIHTYIHIHTVVVFCLQCCSKCTSEYQSSGGVGAILLVGAVLILLIRTILRRRQHRYYLNDPRNPTIPYRIRKISILDMRDSFLHFSAQVILLTLLTPLTLRSLLTLTDPTDPSDLLNQIKLLTSCALFKYTVFI